VLEQVAIATTGPQRAVVDGAGYIIILVGLPTAITGLPTGAVWSNGGALCVA
jgi:hypothetical protein